MNIPDIGALLTQRELAEKVKKWGDKLIADKINPWIFLIANGVKVTRYDESLITYQGVGFEGSPRTVFWEGFIEPFLRHGISEWLDSIAKQCLQQKIEPKPYLQTVTDNLHGCIELVYTRMAQIDQKLRKATMNYQSAEWKKRYGTEIRLRDVSVEIKQMKAYLDRHYNAVLDAAQKEWQTQQAKNKWYRNRSIQAALISAVVLILLTVIGWFLNSHNNKQGISTQKNETKNSSKVYKSTRATEILSAVAELEQIANNFETWAKNERNRFRQGVNSSDIEKWKKDWLSTSYIAGLFDCPVARDTNGLFPNGSKKEFRLIIDVFHLYMPSIAESLMDTYNNFLRSIEFHTNELKKKNDVFWCVNFLDTAVDPTVKRLRHTAKIAKEKLAAEEGLEKEQNVRETVGFDPDMRPDKHSIWVSIWSGIQKTWKFVVGTVVFLCAICLHPLLAGDSAETSISIFPLNKPRGLAKGGRNLWLRFSLCAASLTGLELHQIYG